MHYECNMYCNALMEDVANNKRLAAEMTYPRTAGGFHKAYCVIPCSHHSHQGVLSGDILLCIQNSNKLHIAGLHTSLMGTFIITFPIPNGLSLLPFSKKNIYFDVVLMLYFFRTYSNIKISKVFLVPKGLLWRKILYFGFLVCI